MNDRVGEAFRRIEQTLDELVDKATEMLAEYGITIRDESDRAYHYKNELLSWSYRFQSRRLFRGPEIALVTVCLTCNETMVAADAPVVSIWRRSEIFQVGQLPRWDHTDRWSMPVAEVKERGIADIICTAINGGHARIESVDST